MAKPIGGNKLAYATVTYSNPPHATYGQGDTRYLDDDLSDWEIGSGTALTTQRHSIESLYTDYTGFNEAVGVEVPVHIDLGEARGGAWFVAQGRYGTDTITRPNALLLEHSDNDVDWTTVDDFDGLTAAGAVGAHGWLARWDISGEGVHRYWRMTADSGGSWVGLSSLSLNDDLVVSEGKAVALSVAPNATYPAFPIDLIESGDSDWTNDATNLLTAQSYNHRITSFFEDFVGFLQATDSTVTGTIDLGTAKRVDQVVLKGYWGDNLIYRPKAAILEYSDNNVDWTTVFAHSGLTAGGQPGGAHWLILFDANGETHRYWRVTLTHEGAWLFWGTFELRTGWVNRAIGRPYTLSEAADLNFPDNLNVAVIQDDDTDWQDEGGKLTNLSRGWPGSFGTGVGFDMANDSEDVVVDFGASVGGDHFVAHGLHGSGSNMKTPSAVKIEHSDNNVDWTTVFEKTGLSVVQNAKGRWVVRADISEAGDHRYWRVVVTESGGGQYITLGQIELWDEIDVAVEPEFVVEAALESDTAFDVVLSTDAEFVVEEASESDIAQDIELSTETAFTAEQAVESDTAEDIELLAEPRFTIEVAGESDLAAEINMGPEPVFEVDMATETDTALDAVFGPVVAITLDLATETDTAFDVVFVVEPVFMVEEAGETDLAQDVVFAPDAVLSVEQALETETAFDVMMAAEAMFEVDLATETDTAFEVALISAVSGDIDIGSLRQKWSMSGPSIKWAFGEVDQEGNEIG